jgi:hypothetical protein
LSTDHGVVVRTRDNIANPIAWHVPEAAGFGAIPGNGRKKRSLFQLFDPKQSTIA